MKPRQVVVTGAGGGFGRALAEALAHEGEQVIGTVRDAARAAQLEAAARAQGLPLRFRALELGESASVAALAEALRAEGPLDLLVNNAGAGLFGAFEDVDEDAALWQLQVNLLGPLALTRRLLPALREARGTILFIGSLAGRLALPFQSHYSASKAALAAVSDALRMELAPHGVRVACIEPGDFATGFTAGRRFAVPPDSLYGPALAACRAAAERMEREGPPPETAAPALVRLARHPKPPARAPIGRAARSLALLARLTPDALRERLLARTFGL